MNQNLTMVDKFFNLLHKSFHNESKALWEYFGIEEFENHFKVTWKVTCKCGLIKYRRRAYPKPTLTSNELLRMCIKDGSVHKYIEDNTYEIFFGYVKESAIKAAKQYKGDNYHI